MCMCGRDHVLVKVTFTPIFVSWTIIITKPRKKKTSEVKATESTEESNRTDTAQIPWPAHNYRRFLVGKKIQWIKGLCNHVHAG